MENEESDKRVTHRDILKWIAIGLVIFAIFSAIFKAGMFVGGKRAQFSYRWAENYHQNFGGPRGGFIGDWRKMPIAPDSFIEGHGIFGEIIKINNNDFVIKGQNDIEMVVIFSSDMTIKKGSETIKKEALKIGNRVVIIGSPVENGQIAAKLIRIFSLEESMNKEPSRNNFFNGLLR